MGNVKDSMQNFAIQQALKYIEGNPEENIPKLMALVDRMEETAVDPAHGTVFISHGDCEGDALLVADEIVRRFDNHDIHLNFVGPVIGNHSGPGTVALFFVGSKR